MELISGTLYFVSDEHSAEHASMGCRLGAVILFRPLSRTTLIKKVLRRMTKDFTYNPTTYIPHAGQR